MHDSTNKTHVQIETNERAASDLYLVCVQEVNFFGESFNWFYPDQQGI